MTDYRYLRAFAAAARHSSFKKAADELRISVSAVSRQISLLEASVGHELFVRGNRRVLLTSRGSRLAATTERFSSELRALAEAPPLRIGCLQSVFEFYLADLIALHPREFAGPLDLEIGTPATLEAKAMAGELDLYLSNARPASAMLPHFRLFRETVAWTGPRKRATRPIVFSAMACHYEAAELEAPNRIRINSFNGALALSARGLGEALVAKPERRGARSSRNQWIYAIAPDYARGGEEPVRRVLALLRKQST